MVPSDLFCDISIVRLIFTCDLFTKFLNIASVTFLHSWSLDLFFNFVPRFSAIFAKELPSNEQDPQDSEREECYTFLFAFNCLKSSLYREYISTCPDWGFVFCFSLYPFYLFNTFQGSIFFEGASLESLPTLLPSPSLWSFERVAWKRGTLVES